MKSCAHEEVEELVLGLLPETETARVREHIARCPTCREEHSMFVRERTLFERRAEVLGPVPAAYLAPATFVVAPPPDRRSLFARAMPAVLAVAACAAAVSGIDQLHQLDAERLIVEETRGRLNPPVAPANAAPVSVNADSTPNAPTNAPTNAHESGHRSGSASSLSSLDPAMDDGHLCSRESRAARQSSARRAGEGAKGAMTSSAANDDEPELGASARTGETLASRAPVVGLARGRSEDGLTCTPSERGTCEDPAMANTSVTSSVATP